ncbi:GntR family transcriptional regulator [Jatrophihabitans sp.]|uniref:GntR family transcriptional regulator n=1 Tax=Jatrophihabitans sp. TaxID=1932789 RepID=UPI0030C761D8|nr:GntR family transcriptional regulator [Jatrophihabitans sp.]
MTNVAAVRNRPRLVDAVADTLRDWIVTGRLPGGTQLLQIELAEQLEVSRTPLREAFRILERDGLVRTSNNNRTVEVVTITHEDLRDMFRLRLVTDGLAARLAAERGMSAARQAQAEKLLVELSRTSKPPFNPAQRVRAHAEFHELISLASGNRAMDVLLPLIRTSSAAMYLPMGAEPKSVPRSDNDDADTFEAVLTEADDQHREILEAILKGDAEEADRLARDHSVRTLHLLDDLHTWQHQIKHSSQRKAKEPKSARNGG